ncbi:MAG TPA: carbon monoxide dehydrogenase subunit G [Dongiaceae bacterium]|nr:carbon monoxide dehydrogenase subunit G [Dongiaceae bacterium]
MQLTGTERIQAPRAAVWQALNNPEILKECIPGCESIELLSPTEMKARVGLRLGPIKASFAGRVSLSDIDPPNGYTISGEGSGGPAGGAKGSAKVKLTEDQGATLLDYSVESQVSGKIAQLGARLIDATAQKLAGDFFGKFGTLVATPQAVEPAVSPAAPPSPADAQQASPGASHWRWFLVGAVLIAAVLLWLGLGPK